MLHRFETVTFSKQNADPLKMPRRWLVIPGKVVAQREALLPTLSRVLGLDIYCEARKAQCAEAPLAA
jgi:hypothetical protein